MDQLTNLYKNRCENLQEKINHCQNLLNEGGVLGAVEKMVERGAEMGVEQLSRLFASRAGQAIDKTVTGAAAKVARVPGEVAKEYKPLQQATTEVIDTGKAWEKNKFGKPVYDFNLTDPFNQQFLTTRVAATPGNIKAVESIGGVVPDIEKPLTTLTGMEVLQGIYGKKAATYAELADKAQKLQLRGNFLNPEKPSEFLPPDYTKGALEKPVDIHVGTHYGTNKVKPGQGDLNPGVGVGAFSMDAPQRIANGQRVPAINMNISQVSIPKLEWEMPGIIAHEWTHVSGHQNPNFALAGVMDYGHTTPGNITKNILGKLDDVYKKTGTDVRSYYGDKIPSTDAGLLDTAFRTVDHSHGMQRGFAKEVDLAKTFQDLTPKSQNFMDAQLAKHLNRTYDLNVEFPKLKQYIRDTTLKNALGNREYLSNREIPAQITSAKAWMEKKGLPHIDLNMPFETSKILGKELLDKYKQGKFPELQGSPEIMQMIDMLQHPKGKKLFDMIAKNNKGSDVSQKISGMQKA
jgi:hypothetical protein